MYSKKVIELFENPKNVGTLDETKSNVGTGISGSLQCGDIIRLQIEVEKDRIIDAKFKTYGCCCAIASSSLSTEWLKGKTLDEAKQIKDKEIAEELELPLLKVHCSVLTENAILRAIKDIETKAEKS